MPSWLTDLVILAPWLAAIGLVTWAAVKVWPTARRLMHFIDDVAGEPARPGQDARPGLMERIAAIEDKQTHVEAFVSAAEAHREQTSRTLAEIGDDVAASRHQLGPNGGKSLHDKVDAAIRWQQKHEQKSDAALARIDALEQKEIPS